MYISFFLSISALVLETRNFKFSSDPKCTLNGTIKLHILQSHWHKCKNKCSCQNISQRLICFGKKTADWSYFRSNVCSDGPHFHCSWCWIVVVCLMLWDENAGLFISEVTDSLLTPTVGTSFRALSERGPWGGAHSAPEVPPLLLPWHKNPLYQIEKV